MYVQSIGFCLASAKETCSVVWKTFAGSVPPPSFPAAPWKQLVMFPLITDGPPCAGTCLLKTNGCL